MRLPESKSASRVLLLVCMSLLVLGVDRSQKTTSEIPDISKRINLFTIDLLKHYSTANAPANTILSPQSVFHGLAMSYIASGGNTRKELAEVCHFPNDTEQLLKDLARLRQQIQAATAARVDVSMANSAWLDETYADFRPEYTKEVQTLGASLHRVKFKQKQRVSDDINKWISESTRGKIERGVNPSDFTSRSRSGTIDEPALVLVNAVYFRSDWGSQFDKASTRKRTFHIDTAATVETKMMHQNSLLPYSENETLRFLEIPYSDGSYSMYVVLPKSTTMTIAKLMGGVTVEEIVELKRAASVHRVDVLLPKFEMKSHLGVRDALSAMGVKSAFNNRDADLDGMIFKKAEAFRIYITEIYHDAWIDVHEEGTEAAAATSAVHFSFGCSSSVPRPAPAEFHADHPFLFVIVHNESRSVLFAGWISNPGKL
jgi:serpin B